jgi:hypothetical protein
VNGGEVGDEGEKSLEDLELYVYTLRHVVFHYLDGSRGRGERDGTQGDDALEGVEGNGASHEDGGKEVFCMLVICRDKSDSDSLEYRRDHLGSQ